MVQISLCMVVKNEADNLLRCLQSVSGIVDEVIVLDTGSTDLTIPVAQSLGAKVYESTWQNDFALARNECLTHAQGDWILVLDGDETLMRSQGKALRNLTEDPDTLVINLVREEVGAIQSPFSMVSRLFRRHPEVTFTRPYHAMIDDRVETLCQREPQWKIVTWAEPAIQHWGYRPETIAQGQKFERAAAAMGAYLAENPNDRYTCIKLGALQVEAGNFASGLELLERAQTQPQDNPQLAYELYYHGGIAAQRLGHPEEAIEYYHQALTQDVLPILKVGAHNNLGNLYQAQGQWQDARHAYEAVVRLSPNLPTGYYNLGIVKKALGDLWGAVGSYETALRLNPNFAQAAQNLGVTLFNLGKVAASLSAFQRAIVLHQAQGNRLEAQKLQQTLKEMGF